MQQLDKIISSNLLNKKILISIDEESSDYVSSIQELGEDYMAITIPTSQRMPLILEKGQQVQVKLVGKEEIYLLQQEVIGRKKDTIPLFLLSLPKSIKRIQQRNFVRMPMVLPIEYQTVSSNTAMKGKSLDLSGGGMRIVVKSPLKIDDELLVSFDLPGKKSTIRVKSKVVRTEIHDLEQGKLHCVGIEFYQISEKTREQIISFIFAKMAEQRRVSKDYK